MSKEYLKLYNHHDHALDVTQEGKWYCTDCMVGGNYGSSIHHPKWYWYNAIDGKVKGIIWN